ncbi:integrase core domain-containing protein [Herbaspirillum rubrisubalbicans]|uniref:integrase core domain-containing protein n=1 Tax=Herbaspirillum rubrisubalbicans TaxID=80842 RepID=UPI002351C7E2|nr:transposase [Herbaspirillum rubrisubalbicans]
MTTHGHSPKYSGPRTLSWVAENTHYVGEQVSKLRDELLNREWFRSRAEAKVLIERWRQFYNERRPHSAHQYQPPATVRRAWLESNMIDNRLAA